MKTEARYKGGNEEVKIKLTNMLRGKERKRRIDMQRWIEVDKDLYTLRINCKWERVVGKANK